MTDLVRMREIYLSSHQRMESEILSRCGRSPMPWTWSQEADIS